MKKIEVIVATHKPYWMPKEDMYRPLHVGKAGRQGIGYMGDDVGENISEKNAGFCELTGLYWAWKNVNAEYIGLVHYRRHFSGGWCRGEKRLRVVNQPQMEHVLERVDVVLPRPRNYVIETNYSQFAHAHHASDLDTVRDIIAERHPAYLPAFDRTIKRTKGHRFNMFVMRRSLMNRYCEWLFDILFELEKRIDVSGYDAYNARVFGFIGERLLDVWLETEGVHFCEMPVVNLEKQNWPKKAAAFLMRKCGLRAKDGTIGYRRKKK